MGNAFKTAKQEKNYGSTVRYLTAFITYIYLVSKIIRFWKKIFVRIVAQADCVLLQLFNQQCDKDPFQELPLQPCYSVSDIGTQQYDQFGKIFTLKLQYIFYKERPGVRPGQVKKAERITNKLSQFAAYAIQGDYQGNYKIFTLTHSADCMSV